MYNIGMESAQNLGVETGWRAARFPVCRGERSEHEAVAAPLVAFGHPDESGDSSGPPAEEGEFVHLFLAISWQVFR